jgi:hypothetical protein
VTKWAAKAPNKLRAYGLDRAGGGIMRARCQMIDPVVADHFEEPVLNAKQRVASHVGGILACRTRACMRTRRTA